MRWCTCSTTSHPVVLLLAHVIVLLHERRRLRIMNLCFYEQRVRTDTGVRHNYFSSHSQEHNTAYYRFEKLCSVQRFRFTQPEPRGKHVTRVHTAVTAYVLLSLEVKGTSGAGGAERVA